MPWVNEERKLKFSGHLFNTTEWLKEKIDE